MFTEKDSDRVTKELWDVVDGRKDGTMDAQTAADITNACGKLIKNFALQYVVETTRKGIRPLTLTSAANKSK